ncbi:antibiotic biosynthesis monooxygenase [Paenibacillus sp. LMG 31456]|uniref:Antibiotic biosynthesis monooxygenase n=1 Tax=Paenibacillus foliorum TaxID=2654974 RepID=A0A972JX52_9BACL|nr:antibiotic biosynthesis monooxygenase [Paenibacillus foliorum]NOU92109.1 antibiotic biosynthesis monooxygenase [Paenibacillus foliorum]
MFIQMRTIVVEKGNSDKVVEKFGQPTRVDEMEGLLDVHVMVNRKSKETEEIIAMIRWESEEAWKNWEKDPVHIEGHRNSRGQEKPAYVISSNVSMYDVKKIKSGTFGK